MHNIFLIKISSLRLILFQVFVYGMSVFLNCPSSLIISHYFQTCKFSSLENWSSQKHQNIFKVVGVTHFICGFALENYYILSILGIKNFFWKLVKILLALIIFYKIITDNDALLKFWFDLKFNSWKPGHSGAGCSRPQSSQHKNGWASSY